MTAYVVHNNKDGIVVDPTKPIRPQLPGYTDPADTFPTTEADSCPPPIQEKGVKGFLIICLNLVKLKQEKQSKYV